MIRLRGRSLHGQRLPAAVPWRHWKTTTLVAGLRQAIKAAGAYLLYLPSYSPDLNPIEQAIADILGQFKSDKYANFVRNTR